MGSFVESSSYLTQVARFICIGGTKFTFPKFYESFENLTKLFWSQIFLRIISSTLKDSFTWRAEATQSLCHPPFSVQSFTIEFAFLLASAARQKSESYLSLSVEDARRLKAWNEMTENKNAEKIKVKRNLETSCERRR